MADTPQPKGLRVLACTPLTLLQDAGRWGWQHLGVSPSGVMDLRSAAWANYLLGNPWGTPLLEWALGGLRLRIEQDTWVAVCGAEGSIKLDGEYRPHAARFAVRSGQELVLGPAVVGQWSYLAVAGGFQANPMLGSVATQIREHLGSLDGRGQVIKAGDMLSCTKADYPREAHRPLVFTPDYRNPKPVRVLPNPSVVTDPSWVEASFWGQQWRLSPRSDRMGIRLQGEALAALPRVPWSAGVVTGSIQLPPDGQPIVLMADRQTIGGYPVLGWVHPLDLGSLAQIPAGSWVQFQPIERTQAQQELRSFYRFFRCKA